MGGGSTSTTSENIPQWVSDAGKDIYQKASDFYASGYQPYTGQRVAPFSSDSTTAFQDLRDYLANPTTGQTGTTAAGIVQGAATAPAQTIANPGRVVDENGALGAISDYMNPYVDATLQPTIRNLQDQAQQQRLTVGNLATQGGAYNSARQGVLESSVNKNLDTAVGDATGTAYSNAFTQAMGLRQSDLDRMLGVQETNANLAEQADQRGITGGQALAGIGSQNQADYLTRINALLSSGTAQQQQGQNQLDTDYQAYQAQQQDAYDKLAALVSVIQGLPYSRSSTTTTNDGGAGALGGLGSLLGGIFGL